MRLSWTFHSCQIREIKYLSAARGSNPGAGAAALINRSAFTERKDYDAFRSLFLETFGEDGQHSLVKGVNFAVDTVQTSGLFNRPVDAYRLSTDLISCFKQGN